MAEDCIEWTKAVDKDGYALGTKAGRFRRWSRVVLEEKLGRPLEKWEQALHTCDNPPCVNPEHLWAGTNAQNMADKKAKGRARGRAPIQSDICAVTGCGRPRAKSGPSPGRSSWCCGHKTRKYRHGDVLADVPIDETFSNKK